MADDIACTSPPLPDAVPWDHAAAPAPLPRRQTIFLMHANPLPRRKTLVPKFKVWHTIELAKAVEKGTLFVAADRSGRALTFRLQSATPVNGTLDIQPVDPEDHPETTIVTDTIIHTRGQWPEYLSLRVKRPIGA